MKAQSASHAVKMGQASQPGAAAHCRRWRRCQRAAGWRPPVLGTAGCGPSGQFLARVAPAAGGTAPASGRSCTAAVEADGGRPAYWFRDLPIVGGVPKQQCQPAVQRRVLAQIFPHHFAHSPQVPSHRAAGSFIVAACLRQEGLDVELSSKGGGAARQLHQNRNDNVAAWGWVGAGAGRVYKGRGCAV